MVTKYGLARPWIFLSTDFSPQAIFGSFFEVSVVVLICYLPAGSGPGQKLPVHDGQPPSKVTEGIPAPVVIFITVTSEIPVLIANLGSPSFCLSIQNINPFNPVWRSRTILAALVAFYQDCWSLSRKSSKSSDLALLFTASSFATDLKGGAYRDLF